MASAPALPLSLTLPLPLPLPVSPPLGSTCLLTGLVSAADMNGKPVEILELPTKTTGFRFVVTYSSGGDVKRTLRVKPECLLLCCALRTCLSTDQKVLLVCSGCKADAYCCREHQTEDWKLSHQRKCKLFRTRDDGEPYKLIDLKIPLEQELHRLILRRHVEITFLLRERKEQLKCDLTFFQEKIAQAQIKMLTDWGAPFPGREAGTCSRSRESAWVLRGCTNWRRLSMSLSESAWSLPGYWAITKRRLITTRASMTTTTRKALGRTMMP